MDIFTQLLSPQQNVKNRLKEKKKRASVVCLMNRAIAHKVLHSPFLSSTPGRSTNNLLGNLLMTASSKSNGLLVAPMTTTLLSLLAIAELRPSISCMNSVRMRLCDMLPDDPRDIRAPKSASTSSKNTTQGERRRAREKTALTLCNKKKKKSSQSGSGGLYMCTTYSFSPSPTYISFTSLGWMASILAPLSAATALARRVLPVPGGPKSKAPVVA